VIISGEKQFSIAPKPRQKCAMRIYLLIAGENKYIFVGNPTFPTSEKRCIARADLFDKVRQKCINPVYSKNLTGLLGFNKRLYGRFCVSKEDCIVRRSGK
jgi:hypothetical protein